mmetsp:Transcript_13503/g.28510  ORF Transcript_13503/g.28510 Transcript_13503/m.28510 type:complete len:201 (-) Transcript_13503:2959-3561(-)
MKFVSCLLLGFNWQQRLKLTPNSGDVSERNAKISRVLDTAGAVGQVGSLASEEDQLLMVEVAKDAIPLSESKPARIPLSGEHRLLYSAAPGASSGRVFGNVVGTVSQFFEDDEIFYNRVNFGPLQIALQAKREIMNDSTIKVSFLETSFNLFGKTLKKGQAGGGGVWKVKFVGEVEDENGNKKLVRIMETPSLFVLEQDL